MKNVYDKINDLDFESNEFELNDIEKKKLYMTAKTYKKKANKKETRNRRRRPNLCLLFRDQAQQGCPRRAG